MQVTLIGENGTSIAGLGELLPRGYSLGSEQSLMIITTARLSYNRSDSIVLTYRQTIADGNEKRSCR